MCVCERVEGDSKLERDEILEFGVRVRGRRVMNFMRGEAAWGSSYIGKVS